ncbi:hypothetical protein [Chondromyces apiculatus]|uniref:YbjN domain-containing protein n=1 Tax=Chondromyces apiculatus DSM 436 TaxID=1192034 RepID=A0A017TFD8_9BACT|nr:hypothetical protein [Chondromyces apiculatus]EYF07331.1 Hypothetical protein CAP_0084 [Chondromyces apiculatus DSM 436]
MDRPDHDSEERDGNEPLPTWEALYAHARERYAFDADGAGWFATTVFWADTPRSQQVRVSLFHRSDDAPWIVFRSTVCRREQLDLEEAIRLNEDLAVATLALTSDDVYELFYSFPLVALTVDVLDDLINQVAAAADDLEEPTTGVDEH